MAESDNDSGGGHATRSYPSSEKFPREQDRLLPIANVSRIMKKALPGNAKISKDAKETVQEYTLEFISFITGEESEKCQKEKRKTINGDDLLWAMMTLGFEDYVRPLKVYLQRYRDMEGEKNTVARERDSGAGMSGADGGAGGGGGEVSEFGMALGTNMTRGHQAQVYSASGLGFDGPNHSGLRYY